jgi:protein-disulfide isomerase
MSNLHNQSFGEFLAEYKSTVVKITVVILVLVLGFLAFAWQTESFFFAKNEEVTANILVQDYNISKGNPSANLVFIEFYDFECSACQSFYPITKEFVETRGKEIKFVSKHFPVIGTYSKLAAEATQAAQRQDKGSEFEAEVFNTVSSQSLTNDTLTQIATNIGLDVEKWNADRRSREVKAEVAEDLRQIKNITLPESSKGAGTKASSTPTVVVMYQDKIVDWWAGAISLEELNTQTDKYLKPNAEQTETQEQPQPQGETLDAGTSENPQETPENN